MVQEFQQDLVFNQNYTPETFCVEVWVTISGLEKKFFTYSSCGASGLNFSLVLTPVELVLKSDIYCYLLYNAYSV